MIRPMRAEDVPAVQAIILRNAERLARFGDSHYGEFPEEELNKGTNVVALRGGEIACACQYRPDVTRPTDAVVPCFVVDTKYHDRQTYVRIHIEMERYIRSQGFSRIIAWVPKGHEKFRKYLAEARGYKPYHTDEQGVTFFLLEEIGKCAVLPR